MANPMLMNWGKKLHLDVYLLSMGYRRCNAYHAVVKFFDERCGHAVMRSCGHAVMDDRINALRRNGL